MTITPVTDVVQAKAAMNTFAAAYGSKLDPADLSKFLTLAGHPSGAMCGPDVCEFLYAKIPTITDAGAKAAAQTVLAQVSAWATNWGFQGLSQPMTGSSNSRGFGFYASAMRGLGEPCPIGAWPVEADDPPVATQYAPPPVAAPAPAS